MYVNEICCIFINEKNNRNLKQKKIVLILFLNINKIFDNILYMKLLHNLKKRYIDYYCQNFELK